MKVNLGCGEFPQEGWTNVDLYPPAEVIGDMRELHFEGVEEVNMDHSLEHISWHDVVALLGNIRSWMVPGGTLRIEVPDMAEIMRRGEGDALWMVYTYGAQSSEGEYHRSGYSVAVLTGLLAQTGWRVSESRCFLSEHKYRPGMPCLEVRASA